MTVWEQYFIYLSDGQHMKSLTWRPLNDLEFPEDFGSLWLNE